MEKTYKKHLKFLLFFCVFSGTAHTQAKSGIENYNLLNQNKEYLWMPVVHYQSKKGIYTELRYNYEDVQTVSLFGGKAFAGGKNLKYTIIPMTGFSVGTFTGLSLATNMEMEWKDFYLSTQTQYSFGTAGGVTDFLFSWSEMGYSISNTIFGGIAVQYTRQAGSTEADPGFFLGLESKHITVPVYVFNPFQPRQYFVVGLNCQFDLRRRR